jgi:hypothetical protein
VRIFIPVEDVTLQDLLQAVQKQPQRRACTAVRLARVGSSGRANDAKRVGGAPGDGGVAPEDDGVGERSGLKGLGRAGSGARRRADLSRAGGVEGSKPQGSWPVSTRDRPTTTAFNPLKSDRAGWLRLRGTAKGRRGRGAAVRGRGRAQRPSAGRIGWPSDATAGSRGPRPQDRSSAPSSGARAGLPRALGASRAVVAVVRTRGRGGASSGGAKTQESTGPGGRMLRRAQARRTRGRSRERTPGGSKASKRAERPRAGEPEGLVSIVAVGWRGNSRAGRAVSTVAGKPLARVQLSHPASPSPEATSAARTRRAAETDRTAEGPSRRTSRSTPNPQGSNGRPKGGAAPREGKALKGESQGRTRHETRLRRSGA